MDTKASTTTASTTTAATTPHKSLNTNIWFENNRKKENKMITCYKTLNFNKSLLPWRKGSFSLHRRTNHKNTLSESECRHCFERWWKGIKCYNNNYYVEKLNERDDEHERKKEREKERTRKGSKRILNANSNMKEPKKKPTTKRKFP